MGRLLFEDDFTGGKADGWRPRAGEWQVVADVEPRYEWNREIYHSAGYPGWTAWAVPWQMPDGTIMVKLNELRGETTEPRSQVDCLGLVHDLQIISSADGGNTWTPFSSELWDSNFNSMEWFSTLVCSDGKTVFRNVFGYYIKPEQLSGAWIQKSTDGCRTWSQPKPVLEGPQWRFPPDFYCDQPHRPPHSLFVYRYGISQSLFELSDGTFFLIVSELGMGPRCPRKTGGKLVLTSDDCGETWSVSARIPGIGQLHPGILDENDAVELDNGDVLVLFRCHRRYPISSSPALNFQQCVLHRKGEQWEVGPVESTVMPHSGHPSVIRTKENVLVSTRSDGFWFSTDNGRSWHCREVGPSGYYPKSVQLSDGRILTVYHIGGDFAFPPPRDMSIRATIWSLRKSFYYSQNNKSAVPFRTFAGEQSWADCEVECQLETESCAGLLFRADESRGRHYLFCVMCEEEYAPGADQRQGSGGCFLLAVREGDSVRELASGDVPVGRGKLVQLKVSAKGDKLAASVDGKLMASVVDCTYSTGNIGLVSEGGCSRFTKVKVAALG